MRTAIVTAADARYLPAACCALVSCVQDGKAAAEASLFLLTCGVSALDLEKADSFLKSKGTAAELITVDADSFNNFRIDGYVSALTYSRILLTEFFDNQWDRLLYVDSDTRVTAPLKPLLHANLRGKPLGAVHDYLQYLIYGAEGSRTRLGLRPNSPYFNAGVICFDWRATLASGLLQEAKQFAMLQPDLCKSHDQDALNKVFEGAWTSLDPRWNYMTVAVPDEVLRLDYPAAYRPYISHFAGPVKPWTKSFPKRYENHRLWYLNLLRDSPWPHFAMSDISPTGGMPWTSYARRLKGWLLAQRTKLHDSLAYASTTKMTAARDYGSATIFGSSPIAAAQIGDENPQLAHLIELMVAESAGTLTAI